MRKIEEFSGRIERNRMEADAKTSKNAAKRQKKKERQKQHKQIAASQQSGEIGDDIE